jgi:DNA-binding MarR family transcriptional regulator
LYELSQLSAREDVMVEVDPCGPRTAHGHASSEDLVDFLTLRTIELGVDTAGGLVGDLGLNPAVVSRTLTKLTKAGLIGRRIDRDDSRRSRVDLTKKGARTTAAIAARIRLVLAQRLEHLDPQRVQAVLECLETL